MKPAALVFDPADPFPLFHPDTHSYREEQTHSAEVDAWLGLRTEETEAAIARTAVPGVNRKEQELWIGLPVKSLLTPYTEIRRMLEMVAPKPGHTVVDLGAGYARMAPVLARHHPGVAFIGYEFLRARVIEARRCLGLEDSGTSRIQQQNLGDSAFSPVPAEFYFLYDFGARETIEKTLQDLRRIAETRAITVIGRGRSSRDAIERHHPWLSQVNAPRHHGNFSIYRS